MDIQRRWRRCSSRLVCSLICAVVCVGGRKRAKKKNEKREKQAVGRIRRGWVVSCYTYSAANSTGCAISTEFELCNPAKPQIPKYFYMWVWSLGERALISVEGLCRGRGNGTQLRKATCVCVCVCVCRYRYRYIRVEKSVLLASVGG